MEYQGPWESEKLWHTVTLAINRDDQVAATEAKTRLEEAQRQRAKERKRIGQEWVSKYFVQVYHFYIIYIIIYHIINLYNLIFPTLLGYYNGKLGLSTC